MNYGKQEAIGGANVYAKCYSMQQPVIIVADHRSQKTVVASYRNSDGEQIDILQTDFETTCPAGTSSTAGGYRGFDAYNSAPDPQGAGWVTEDLERSYQSRPVDTSGFIAVVECVTF